MKTHFDLDQLVAEIHRQEEARVDLIGPQGELRYVAAGPTEPEKLAFQGRAMALTRTCHDQVATMVGMPKSFYDRFRTRHPDLHADCVNRLLQDDPGRRKVVRVLDGQARAVLSDTYLRVGHGELLDAVLPELDGMGMKVESAFVNHERLYLKAFTPRLEGEIRRGDVVRAGIVISNSEVGTGPIRIQPAMYRLVCTNGLIVPEKMGGFTRRHTGKVIQGGADGVAEHTPLAVILDAVRARLQQGIQGFSETVERLAATTQVSFGRGLEVEQVVERLRERHFPMSDLETAAVVHQLRVEESSFFGVIQAVTRVAQDQRSYDRATEFEALGGQLLALRTTEWEALVAAA